MKRNPDKTTLPGVLLMLAVTSWTAAAEPRMSFLENGSIKVGVDLDLGGAITWLSKADGVNRVNNFDHGRQIQLSYFSGPVPFETPDQKPSDHWRHLGWNPIQAGDDFRNGRTRSSSCVPRRTRRPSRRSPRSPRPRRASAGRRPRMSAATSPARLRPPTWRR